MSTRSPTKRKQQALVSPRVQEIRDDEELHDGVPINRELAVASQLSSVEVSPGELEPARPPDTSILMGALIENWINTKYPGVSREHRRALFHEIAIEMTGSTGIDFEAAAHDSLATKRNEYISAVEDYAAARFDRLSLDVVAPTAQSAGLPPSCPNPGNGAVRGIIFPPRIVPKRSLSMPDERTMVASRALVKVMEASPFPTVHVQDSVIIGQQALAKTSRLHEEYLVHEMIGKGGFGEVFKVVHKLDHAVYALKQIRMRASDFVKEDLNVGVKRVLAELRTLAMMEHPNIVRYFYSWTESNHGLAVAPLEPPNHHADPLGKIVEEPSFSDGSKLTDASGPKIIFEKSESESADSESFDSVSEDSHSLNSRDINIVFEKSESESADSKTFDSVSEDSHSLNSRDISIVFDYSSSDETVSNKKAINDGVNVVFKDSTSGSVSENIASSNNDDMNIVFGVSSDEIATNEVDNSASSDSGTITEDASEVFADGSSAPGRALIRRRASINEPTVTVYITMSLHPVSLTNYITGRRSGRKIGHCFCPLASLYIFRDILNGVEYLHSKGIVHRDLKPGNVFLNVGEPMKCCDQPGSAVEPKIGDFGLVAVIDTEDSPLSESSRKEHHLGTTFYSAPEGGRSPAVDVWALGVILVELMCQFGTATERSIVLHKLTNGDSDVLDIDKRFTEIIKGCCCHDTRKRLHVPELKRVVANAIKEYIPYQAFYNGITLMSALMREFCSGLHRVN